MTASPAISVVIIFLDAARFLAEAVDSVRAQTETDWELILVDDGSADGSTQIAREYAAAAPDRIRYVEHPGHVNRGMSASRNAGVGAAHGEWIALLDSDDTWRPGHLAQRLAVARAEPGVDVVYGPSVIWHSWDPAAADADTVQDIGYDQVRDAAGVQFAELYVRHSGWTPVPASMLIRRDAWDRLGGFEDRFRGMNEDQVFAFKAVLDGRVRVTPDVTAYYRQHAASCVATSLRSHAGLEARAAFLQWARRYVAARHPEAGELDRLLRHHLSQIRRSSGPLAVLTRIVHRVTPASLMARLRHHR